MPAKDRSDETVRQSSEAANERAISILGGVLAGDAKAAAQAHSWTTWLQSHQHAGNSLTVLEHTVVAYILRSGFLKGFPESRCHLDVESVLRTSWLHLAEKGVEIRHLTGRLPRSALRKASREERLFHLAAFQPAGPKAAMSQKTFGYDYVPELRDLVAAAGIVTVAFTDMAGVLVSGAIGYTVATVAEYGMHRWAGHEAGGPLKPLLITSRRHISGIWSFIM